MSGSGAPGRLRVLGIDPGTLRLGYGVIDVLAPGRFVYVECGVLEAPARQARLLRLVEIARGLEEVVDELRPGAAAMEEAFFGKNVKSTVALAEARGAAAVVLGRRALAVSGYPPAMVKHTVVGQGRATKEQVGFVVRALLGLRRVPSPDAADALAIAICHARHMQRPTTNRGRTR